MSIRVCVGGATGWTGSRIVEAILKSDELQLTGAVARQAAGTTIGPGVTIHDNVAAALSEAADVYIDYTHPSAVRANTMEAIDRGVAVVIGTSGLTGDDYRRIDVAARNRGTGVVAAGNFSITAALLKHFACIAARHAPHWEVIDYAYSGKPDAPSGTAQELAETLGDIAKNRLQVPIEETLGNPSTRGASIGGAQVHSVRLPSFVLSVETIFGLPGERLSIRHDAGASAEPYVGGTLLAAKAAPKLIGLTRGLDTLLFSS